MFLKSRQNSSFDGHETKRTMASSVNQAVQTVSMIKNRSRKLRALVPPSGESRKNGRSRKFGASSSTQCVIANVGSVSTQKRMMETSVITTDTMAMT